MPGVNLLQAMSMQSRNWGIQAGTGRVTSSILNEARRTFLPYSVRDLLVQLPGLIHRFHKASDEQLAAYPHTVNPMNRGTNGPIQTTVPHAVATIDALFQETMVNKGIKAISDPYGGDVRYTFSLLIPPFQVLPRVLIYHLDHRDMDGRSKPRS